jgi:hypothetical protein
VARPVCVDVDFIAESLGANGDADMAQLSHSAQLQVDHAKDGIEDLQECISRLTIFMNGFELWFHHQDFDDRIAYLEAAVAKVLIRHFGSNSWEAHRLIERTRISSSPHRSNKDRRKRELEHTIAIAIEALEDAIRLLKERIENIKSGRATSKPDAQRAPQPRPAPSKNPTVVREQTSRGDSLRDILRRLRGS